MNYVLTTLGLIGMIAVVLGFFGLGYFYGWITGRSRLRGELLILDIAQRGERQAEGHEEMMEAAAAAAEQADAVIAQLD